MYSHCEGTVQGSETLCCDNFNFFLSFFKEEKKRDAIKYDKDYKVMLLVTSRNMYSGNHPFQFLQLVVTSKCHVCDILELPSVYFLLCMLEYHIFSLFYNIT